MSMWWATAGICFLLHISGGCIENGTHVPQFVTFETVSLFKLDFNFGKGKTVIFETIGDATISLSGYLIDLPEPDARLKMLAQAFKKLLQEDGDDFLKAKNAVAKWKLANMRQPTTDFLILQ